MERLRSIRQSLDWQTVIDGASLLVAAPMLLAPRVTWAPLLLALPALWLMRWRWTGSPVPSTPLNVPLLLMGLMLLVSLWATFSIEFSLAKISGLVFSLALFFVVVRIAGERFALAAGGFLAAGVGVAVLGLLATDWRAKVPLLGTLADRLPRVVTGLPAAESGIHPNELGGVLILFVPLALVLTVRGWRDRSWALNGLIALGTVLLLGVTALSQSRSALMGLLAGIVLLLAFAGRRGRIALLLLIVVGAVLVSQIGVGTLLGLDSTVEPSPIGEITFASRFEIWSRAIYGLEDFVFTGMGMNTFRRVAPVLYPFFMISPEKDVAHAHNVFLQTGLDLGVPGLIAYISLWLGAFALLWIAYRRNAPEPLFSGLSQRSLALGLAGGMLAHLIFGMTDAVALGAKPGFLWWWMLALIVALERQRRDDGLGLNEISAELTANS